MNTLQQSYNYYEKYKKYKKKYIDYKNNLLTLSRKKSALIGGGLDAQISFFDVENNQNLSQDFVKAWIKNLNGIVKPFHINIKYTDTTDKTEKVVKYKIIEKAGGGIYGTVYKLEQIESQPGSNNSFAIKLTMLNQSDDLAENKKEGTIIDTLDVEERIKAIYQGRTDNIDFAIYNYLGDNLETFLKKYSITGKTLLSLIKQLHIQLYKLNSKYHFHSDVKIENIVVRSTDASMTHDDFELSLIDYGLFKKDTSNYGTTHSMCIYGCAYFLLEKSLLENSLTENLKQLVEQLLPKATSTDYVGFFNVIICMLISTFCAWNIYSAILEIDTTYTIDNLLNILCLLCYVSNSTECDEFFKLEVCKKIKDKITLNLRNIITSILDNFNKTNNTNITVNNITDLFNIFDPYFSSTEEIPSHTKRRILFLSFLYTEITMHSDEKYKTFVHITKLPKLLWDLSSCLDLQFNLSTFNTNFSNIFNEKLLEPLHPPPPPPPTLPPPPPPTLPPPPPPPPTLPPLLP